MLTPAEIRSKSFKSAFRGADAREVELFLQQVADEIEHLQNELNHVKKLAQKHEEMYNAYREKEETLNNTLLSSQKFMDHMKHEAELHRQEILQAAHEEGRKIIQRESREIERLKKQQETLRQENKQFQQRIRYIIKEHEELLARLEEENHAPSGP